MKTSEIRELSVAELKERIAVEKKNLTQMKINHTISPLEKPTTITRVRKDIARMMTILTQKELEK